MFSHNVSIVHYRLVTYQIQIQIYLPAQNIKEKKKKK